MSCSAAPVRPAVRAGWLRRLRHRRLVAEFDNSAVARCARDRLVELGDTRQIVAHGGKGSVTITPRMPEVTVNDSEDRIIVSSRMGNIADWMDEDPLD